MKNTNMVEKLEIYFVTGNPGKFAEVKKYLDSIKANIDLKQLDLDIPEYQSLNVHYVAQEKALEAYRKVGKPILVDDGGIFLQAYNNFPGTLSKYVYQGIGLEGFWKLACDDPRAYFLTCLVYVDGVDSIHFFEGRCSGIIVNPAGREIGKHLPFADIFIPEREGCDVSLNELRRRGTSEGNHREAALKKFIAWLKID